MVVFLITQRWLEYFKILTHVLLHHLTNISNRKTAFEQAVVILSSTRFILDILKFFPICRLFFNLNKMPEIDVVIKADADSEDVSLVRLSVSGGKKTRSKWCILDRYIINPCIKILTPTFYAKCRTLSQTSSKIMFCLLIYKSRSIRKINFCHLFSFVH